MNRFVVAFAVFIIPIVSVDAQTLYRCQAGDKVAYSDRPCMTGTETRIQAEGGPTPKQRAEARQRLNRQIAQQEARARAQQVQARQEWADAEARALQRNAPESAKRQQQVDTEKHLVHTDSGWDRLTKAQIADRERRLTAEANATAAQAAATANTQRQILLNGVPMVSAGGGYIAPQTGAFYIDAGGGIINSQTGQFIPK